MYYCWFYPCISYWTGGGYDKNIGKYNKTTKKSFYTLEELLENFKKDEPKSFKEYDIGKKFKSRQLWFSPKSVNNFFKRVNQLDQSKDWTDFFLQYKTPIFIYNTDKNVDRLEINAELKKIEFYKVFDNYSAFQELEMFISSTLCLTDSSPSKYKGMKINNDISDKDMRDAKGFDNKSFKKRKK